MTKATLSARQPNKRGTTLILATASVVGLALVALCWFDLVRVLGGSRQAQNATDAGTLNLAHKAQAVLGVKMTAREKEEFGDLVDTNGLITLRMYNRVVGRAMLIALNAQELKTPEALKHAHEVLDLAQTGNMSIGERLAQVLSDASRLTPLVESVSQANSTRFLGAGKVANVPSQCSVAYLNAGAPSNVYLDWGYLKPAQKERLQALNILHNDSQGHSLLKGYQTINLGDGFVFSFVALDPESQTHRVSDKDFNQNRELATRIDARLVGKVPPNTFSTTSTTVDARTRQSLLHHSCATVGTSGRYPTTLSGYIRIINPRGFAPPGKLPPNKSFYAGVGMTGVYLFSDGNQPMAFSSDPDIGAKWAAYNKDSSTPRPPLIDEEGNTYVYDKNGSPASMETLSKIKSMAAPVTGCNDWNVTGANVNANCHEFLDAFLNAYPSEPPIEDGDSSQLIAVEAMAGNLMTAAIENAKLHRDHNPSGCLLVKTPRTKSGLRLFTRSARVAFLNYHFSKPGTVPQLLHQVDANAMATVLSDIAQRVRQFKPDAREAEILQCLQSETLELDSVHYLYLNNTTGKLVLSTTPPPTVQTIPAADGVTRVYGYGPYQTLGITVNPPLYAPNWPMPGMLWLVSPPANTTALGSDFAMYTPGSGYRGNLGDLSFANQCLGDGTFCNSN